jgi:hypothetical protein
MQENPISELTRIGDPPVTRGGWLGQGGAFRIRGLSQDIILQDFLETPDDYLNSVTAKIYPVIRIPEYMMGFYSESLISDFQKAGLNPQIHSVYEKHNQHKYRKVIFPLDISGPTNLTQAILIARKHGVDRSGFSELAEFAGGWGKLSPENRSLYLKICTDISRAIQNPDYSDCDFRNLAHELAHFDRSRISPFLSKMHFGNNIHTTLVKGLEESDAYIHECFGQRGEIHPDLNNFSHLRLIVRLADLLSETSKISRTAENDLSSLLYPGIRDIEHRTGTLLLTLWAKNHNINMISELIRIYSENQPVIPDNYDFSGTENIRSILSTIEKLVLEPEYAAETLHSFNSQLSHCFNCCIDPA